MLASAEVAVTMLFILAVPTVMVVVLWYAADILLMNKNAVVQYLASQEFQRKEAVNKAPAPRRLKKATIQREALMLLPQHLI